MSRRRHNQLDHWTLILDIYWVFILLLIFPPLPFGQQFGMNYQPLKLLPGNPGSGGELGGGHRRRRFHGPATATVILAHAKVLAMTHVSRETTIWSKSRADGLIRDTFAFKINTLKPKAAAGAAVRSLKAMSGRPA